jgi:phage terminase large subunit-like protein
VLGDHTAAGLSPEGWARKVDAAVRAHGAGQVIAEKNQGGEMVRSVLRAAGVAVPVRLEHAGRSKAERAAPIVALFEAGKVRIAGHFPELEDELAGMSWEGCEGASDRADAMVWALTALLGGHRTEPSIRQL